ncbi:Trp biosynthesis-associated membrane protein [Microbacterium dauci]|uniref:Trp biosynthesis-associated membrane protein n=1 Tax=Microbacterium dauci TaxID=3048008 RepID=A0ABT6ZCQ0_9MICO|nr:Trp biosynthesis-associated membrane protein [Microbacterium sp. LX3-4]MDJ1113728.1 Trp biosynthesis-associated membrane protein [Microbacterium sp. LX3-4]
MTPDAAPRRWRTRAVLPVLAGGAVSIIGSTQTWLDLALRDGAQLSLAVPGASALPVLAPLSLAALALGLALTIVGRVLRYVFGAIAVLMGAGLAVASLRIALTMPIDAVVGTVTEATGLSGVEAAAGIVTTMALTPWPWVTAAAGLAVVAGGAIALVTGHRWAGAGRKYRQDAAPADGRPRDAVDSWDDLSRGEDPTR